MLKITQLSFLLLVFHLSVLAQSNHTITVTNADSEVKILGTSSLHDWEENVKDYSVQGSFDGSNIKDLRVEFKTASIESGKSIMDEKTHEALQAKKYPTIYFETSSLTLNKNTFNGEGQLFIAGQKRTIPINGTTKKLSDELIEVEGSVNLTMSDFGIDPPTAMFGTLTTGDEVTIAYKFKLMLK